LRPISLDTSAPVPDHDSGTEWELVSVFRRIGLLGLIYIIIGLVIAWNHAYITVALLKTVLSAILAVLLWWLVLLGVNFHLG
jgi:hypothetical protein